MFSISASVFYVSLLRKYAGNLTFIVSLKSFGVKENLLYEKFLVQILVHQDREFKNKVISLKVLRMNKLVDGATWKHEMISKYPHIFPSASILA